MDDLYLKPRFTLDQLPPVVRGLFEFVQDHPHLWPLLVDCLLMTGFPCDREQRSKAFNDARDAIPDYKTSVTDADFNLMCDFLHPVYDVLTKNNPNGTVLEYLVLWIGPFVAGENAERGRECTVCYTGEDGDEKNIVDEDKKFDAAFLSEEVLEGHECKAQVINYIPMNTPFSKWNSKRRKKLEFMKRVYDVARNRIRQRPHIYLTGFDVPEDVEIVEGQLLKADLSCIKVLGREDIFHQLQSVRRKAS